jgi:glycerol kinase
MEVLNAMEADSGLKIKELRVDGGATANDILMQFQADVLDTTVIRPQVTEVTALGAAYLAGLAVGYWNSMDDISGQWKIDKSFNAGEAKNIEERIKGWNRAVKAAKAYAEN